MKTLFEFTLPKKVETEETTVTETDGKKISTTSTVIKEIPVKVAIKKPTRELIDEGKLFYAVETSKAHQAGVISEVLLRKRLMNDGGTLTEKEKMEYGNLYMSYYENLKEHDELNKKIFSDLTDKEKMRKQELEKELGLLMQRINSFESTNSQIFENTVESLARNASMRFWVLNLSYVQKIDDKGITKDEFLPLFGPSDYNSKLKIYDKLEEGEDEFYLKVIHKLARLISYWYINQAKTTEDFQKLLEAFDEEEKSNQTGDVVANES